MTEDTFCNYLKEKLKSKEAGVWIVYDLEANRKIQELLQRERFAFKFDPSLRILRQEALKDVEKIIDEFDFSKYAEASIGESDMDFTGGAYVDERELKKELKSKLKVLEGKK